MERLKVGASTFAGGSAMRANTPVEQHITSITGKNLIKPGCFSNERIYAKIDAKNFRNYRLNTQFYLEPDDEIFMVRFGAFKPAVNGIRKFRLKLNPVTTEIFCSS